MVFYQGNYRCNCFSKAKYKIPHTGDTKPLNNVDSSTNIFYFAGVEKGADSNFSLLALVEGFHFQSKFLLLVKKTALLCVLVFLDQLLYLADTLF